MTARELANKLMALPDEELDLEVVLNLNLDSNTSGRTCTGVKVEHVCRLKWETEEGCPWYRDVYPETTSDEEDRARVVNVTV